MAIDVREYWNFDDPAKSETVFRGLLETGNLDEQDTLEVWAQIARTYSLRRECDTCHAILGEKWDDAMVLGGRAKASFELERGRAFRTGKDLSSATPFFESASQSDVDDLRIDAFHMLAIDAEKEEANRLNQLALKQATESPSMFANRWQGTLCNNLGWTAFEAEQYEEAVNYFQRALDERIKYQNDAAIPVAQWCLARGLRAMGRLEEAKAIQMKLVESGNDGYAFEELAEIFSAEGKADDAKPYAKQALVLLQDSYGADSPKVARLKELAGD